MFDIDHIISLPLILKFSKITSDPTSHVSLDQQQQNIEELWKTWTSLTEVKKVSKLSATQPKAVSLRKYGNADFSIRKASHTSLRTYSYKER